MTVATSNGAPLLRFSPERLRDMRERVGWTLQDLAYRLRLQASSVSRWESGKFEPREQHLRSLAKIFKCSEKAFFVPV